MSSQNPDKPTSSSDTLRRLEALPASTAGGSLGDLTPLPGRTDEPEPTRRPGLRYLLYGCGVLGIGILLWLVLGGPVLKPTDKKSTETESNLETARRSLAESTDLNTCRIALTQINAELGHDSPLIAPSLNPARAKELKDLLGLSPEALSEIEGNIYTKLDGIYLEQCLLFRDAARTLDPSNLPGVSPSTLRERWLDRVRLAFAWTVRQVRLVEEPEAARRVDPLTLPPGYVLRRGVGSPLERALVFLALLEQLAPPEQVRGCLVYCPEKDGAEPTLWACGVLIDGKSDLYLFDPRLGLPLPSTDEAGIATLGAIVKEPGRLKPLSDVGPYTPAGGSAGKAQIQMVVSLSALAPRVGHLQDKLLGSTLTVRLAQDVAAAQTAFDAAVRSAGLASRPVFWAEGKHVTPTGEVALTGADLLRRFVPEAQGGSDRSQYLLLSPDMQRRFLLIPAQANARPQPFERQAAWQLADVPFQYYPALFNNPERFPRTVGLGQRVYVSFASPFIQSVMESGSPRDLSLRGRYTQAIPDLIREREDRKKMERALESLIAKPEGVGERLAAWVDEASTAYADQVQATQSGNNTALAKANRQIEALWRKADIVSVMLLGSQARPRLRDITYQVALCKQEMGEAAQTRLELAQKLNLTLADSEKRMAEQIWRDALTWWDRYLNEHRDVPGRAAVRRMRARALECLGATDQAIAVLRDLSPPMWPMEQIAALYLAATLKK